MVLVMVWSRVRKPKQAKSLLCGFCIGWIHGQALFNYVFSQGDLISLLTSALHWSQLPRIYPSKFRLRPQKAHFCTIMRRRRKFLYTNKDLSWFLMRRRRKIFKIRNFLTEKITENKEFPYGTWDFPRFPYFAPPLPYFGS